MKTKIIILSTILLFSGISCAQNSDKQKKNNEMEKIEKSKEEWKRILTPMQYFVTQENGTEYAFTGKYDKFFESGKYLCVCCGNELFESETKYNSGCGWPAFYQAKEKENIIEIEDNSHGMKRVEVRCAKCNAHLGHVFPDGPKPTGIRYCINSEALKFVKQ